MACSLLRKFLARRPSARVVQRRQSQTDDEGQLMPVPVKPVAKRVYVCDDVVGDPSTGKVTLVNLWDAVRLPPDATFPYSLAKLCVFVWWRDGAGKVKTRI